MKIHRHRLKDIIMEVLNETEWFDITSGETAPPHSTTTEEEPNSYEKLMTAYHALEEVVVQYPQLQGSLDSVAETLDALDAGDSHGTRANENLKKGPRR